MSKIPPIRAVVTDVDGTLTDARRRLDPEVLRLLGRLEAQGIPVVLATGNVLPIALALHRSMGLSGPIVAENGGILYHRRDGHETVQHLAHRSVAWAAFQRLRRAGLPVRRLFTDRWRETEVGLETGIPVAQLRPLLKGLRVRVESTGFAVHLIERGVGKLSTLRIALAPLGITPANCLIAGDGDNDVTMLQAAGWAVSFPSGSSAARRAADYVAEASYSFGFVQALKAANIVSL